MISNALALGTVASAPSGKPSAARAGGGGDNAFDDALKQTGSKEENTGDAPKTAGERPSVSIFSDVRWRGALDKSGAATGKDGEAAGAEGEVAAAAGEALRNVQSRGGKGAADIDGKEKLTEDDADADTKGDETDGNETASSGKAAESAAAVAVAVTAQLRVAKDTPPAKDAKVDPASGGRKAKEPVEAIGETTVSADTAEQAVSDGAETELAALAPQPKPSGNPEKPVARGRTVVAAAQAAAQSARTTASETAATPQADGDVQSAAPQADAAADTAGRGRLRPADPRLAADASAQAPKDAAAETLKPAVVTPNQPALAAAPETPAGRQVAAAVAEELADMRATRIAAATTASQAGTTVKTLRLQLNPGELGAVSIQIQSVGGEMKVAIRAETEHAARMLQTDSDAIHSALRAIGVASADVTIQHSRSDANQPQSSGREAPGQQANAQDNRGGASNESRQSYRESPTNDHARNAFSGSDDGDGGAIGSSRIII